MISIKHLRETLECCTKFVPCDSVGENLSAEKASREAGLSILFKYTAPNSPLQNGNIERKLLNLSGHVCSILNSAGLSQEFQKGLWAESVCAATYLDNLNFDNRPNHNSPPITKTQYPFNITNNTHTYVNTNDIVRTRFSSIL